MPSLLVRFQHSSRAAADTVTNAGVYHNASSSTSIPFRAKGKIRQPAACGSQLKDFGHFAVGQFEIENVDVLREPFDARGARDRGHVLLHEPAQTNLGRALAMRPSDPAEGLILLDSALRDRAVGDERDAVFRAGLPHLG